jgi:hypothetical protein
LGAGETTAMVDPILGDLHDKFDSNEIMISHSTIGYRKSKADSRHKTQNENTVKINYKIIIKKGQKLCCSFVPRAKAKKWVAKKVNQR